MSFMSVEVERITAHAVAIPTDRVESDGTLSWHATGCVLVRAHGAGAVGVGYSYGPPSLSSLIETELASVARGSDAMAPEQCCRRMLDVVRNFGRQGLAAHAISAVDIALWDLKAKLLGVSLVDLWGRVREKVPVYGSGGFTSYGSDELREQLARWVEQGIRKVKIKVGRRPANDLERVRTARDVVGPDVALFVDANGAYRPKEALAFAESFHSYGVEWFEEPVSSDDREGLRFVREHGPSGMAITAGEYAYHPYDFRRLLDAGAVDVLQADATRCLGFTGFRNVASLCEAWNVPMSAHTAPAVHAQVGMCSTPIIHTEYFHDHVRCEQELFRGQPSLEDGMLVPESSAAGMGLEIIDRAAERFAA